MGHNHGDGVNKGETQNITTNNKTNNYVQFLHATKCSHTSLGVQNTKTFTKS